MAELDLDALEQAAREAGGGCWFSAGWTVGSRGFEVGDLKSRDRICSDATERCAEFIAAANPAAISELLDRLKAAESEAIEQARLNGMGSEREAALMAKLEAAEKTNRGWLRANATGGWIDNLRIENDTLRAKIDRLEEDTKAVILAANSGAHPKLDESSLWQTIAKGMTTPAHIAQPAPKAVAYLDLGVGGYMDIGTDLTDEELAAIPKGRHMLGIVGTYGIEGYVPAQPAPIVPDTYAAGINAVAAMLQSKADEYAKEHGHDDMGGLSFGPGMGGEIKMDYYTNLIELVDGVRAMLAAAPEAKP